MDIGASDKNIEAMDIKPSEPLDNLVFQKAVNHIVETALINSNYHPDQAKLLMRHIRDAQSGNGRISATPEEARTFADALDLASPDFDNQNCAEHADGMADELREAAVKHENFLELVPKMGNISPDDFRQSS